MVIFWDFALVLVLVLELDVADGDEEIGIVEGDGGEMDRVRFRDSMGAVEGGLGGKTFQRKRVVAPVYISFESPKPGEKDPGALSSNSGRSFIPFR